MKNINNLSLKIKFPVMMGIVSLLVLALICLLLLMPLRSNSLESSSRIAQLSAVAAGEQIAERVNSTASVIRAYSGVIAQMASTELIPKEQKREQLLTELDSLTKNDKRLNNVWCTLEPDALDGMDSQYIGRTGSNSTGVFAPWFADGSVTITENDYDEDFYATPKATRREHLTEPYWDEVNEKKIHMFSICIPIIANGNFIGVLGADFYADELGQMISNLSKNSSGKLITDEGNIAVHRDPELIGQKAENGNRDILDKLPEGRMFEGMFNTDGHDVYKVFVPIRLGETTDIWYYAVDVPREEIYAQARETAGYLVVYCLIGVVLIVLGGWMLISYILKGVEDVTGIIHQLSFGHIDMKISENQNLDEVGKMKSELGNLVDGLQRTAIFAKSIGDGNLHAEYRPLSSEDILGNSLLDMRNSLQNAATKENIRKKEEEQRNWATSGLAMFAEILRRDNSDMEALSYNVVSNMVKYLEANQGGLFVLNEQDGNKTLELTACYAFDRKKLVQKSILPGEGLVGACYLEGEPIYMTDIPKGYITITSGLGDDSPDALLICPLKINGEVYGVIELASIRAIEPYRIEFVQKLSESIAATIATVRTNIRTGRLLEQTRMQAEELANQEEELRQNMEEMQATQEEMRRREMELLDKLAAMTK